MSVFSNLMIHLNFFCYNPNFKNPCPARFFFAIKIKPEKSKNSFFLRSLQFFHSVFNLASDRLYKNGELLQNQAGTCFFVLKHLQYLSFFKQVELRCKKIP